MQVYSHNQATGTVSQIKHNPQTAIQQLKQYLNWQTNILSLFILWVLVQFTGYALMDFDTLKN